LDLPFSQARSVNLSDYDIYDEASFAGSQGSTENPFVFAAAQLGRGGYPRIFNICTAGQLENKEAARGRTQPALLAKRPDTTGTEV